MTLYTTTTHVLTHPVAGEAVPAARQIDLFQEVRVCRTDDGGWLFGLPDGSALPRVETDGEYQNIVLHANPGNRDERERFLLRTAFECRFCFEGILSFHAACVELDGYAVAFTGHSGLGKSTRARAWEEALGAAFISGDRPALRLTKGGCMACGVPWDGKEQIFRDVEVPLKCILEVRRSPENYIRRLSAEQARQLAAQQSFVPMWDADAAAMAMANIRRLIQSVPVYRVFCGPDAADARAVHDILIHHPEQIREEEKDMRIKDGFVLRNVIDEYVVMPTGDNIAKFAGTVVLNEVSAFLFKQLENPVSRADLLSALFSEYDVDEATAGADLDALLDQFREMGLLED